MFRGQWCGTATIVVVGRQRVNKRSLQKVHKLDAQWAASFCCPFHVKIIAYVTCGSSKEVFCELVNEKTNGSFAITSVNLFATLCTNERDIVFLIYLQHIAGYIQYSDHAMGWKIPSSMPGQNKILFFSHFDATVPPRTFHGRYFIFLLERSHRLWDPSNLHPPVKCVPWALFQGQGRRE